MNEDQIRQIIRDELKDLMKSDRFTFSRLLQILDGRNIQLGLTTGTKLGTSASQKLGFWNATPDVQPTTSVGGADFVENAGTTVNTSSRFDGYSLQQVVKALRNIGILT